MDSISHIKVRSAKEHNLKAIDVDIPRDKLVVLTGLSGSGKSSLAFDTIYAEGQRRYVESLSAYARQFLNMMQKPDVESISGLSPAISIEQKTTSKNPRSTVGTVTEIYDYLRLLFARVGVPYSPATGKPIKAQQISDMIDAVLKLDPGLKLYIYAPLVKDRKGEFKKEITEITKKGFQRVRINGELFDIDEMPVLDKKYRYNIDVLVDRLISGSKDGIGERLADSLRTALDISGGLVVIDIFDENDKKDPLLFSEKFACPVSGFTLGEIEPRLFSFNAPTGACEACDGLGREDQFDESLVVIDGKLSVYDGAIVPWTRSSNPYYRQTIEALSKHYNFNPTIPWDELDENIKKMLLYGNEGEQVTFRFDDGGRVYNTKKSFEGVISNLKRRFDETVEPWLLEEFKRYRSEKACAKCNGYRLKKEALCVRVADLNIGECCNKSIKQLLVWAGKLEKVLSKSQLQIGSAIIREISNRLTFLDNVGLEYLTLSRASGTLSGGESQRIRLASQIGSGLTGVLYVLDEPSIGLHQRDNRRLIKTLKDLKAQGNSVLVVEHDEEAIREADHVIDLGPGAGVKGGYIVAQGSPLDVIRNEKSLTGLYLSGKKSIPIPQKRRTKRISEVKLIGANGNNLKNLTVSFPTELFVCVTGVSGGGKSTLVIETLFKAAASKLNGSKQTPAKYQKIEGLENFEKVIDIDQSPIGRTPRSNPATYTGAFTHIRDWFTGLPSSKARGYMPGRFSFNVKGGRCEACQGDGLIKIEMHFLADVYVECDQCLGKRYNRETLEVKFKDKNISDVLEMTVSEAEDFFKAVPSIREKMSTLKRVGLGYIKVGQQATTLSGGEAQRVKLAKELSRRSSGSTLYILDEPTTGLHFDDIKKLLEILHELVDKGNTVVVIEHNLDVIKTADYVIDIGPEGGDKGGKVVCKGTPEYIKTVKESFTGEFLSPIV
ncbi:excinuclease ABC subunit UvrA [Paracoccaceae bacterium]|nr:excinuclease ABC subunit UvrA [Paracoccaceae bacterium]